MIDVDEDWFTLEELSRRIGGMVWIEERLFETIGRWSVNEPAHAVAVLFATTSRHHGWHAEVLRQCLPTSEQLMPDDLVSAPTSGWQLSVDRLGDLAGDDVTTTRLSSLVRVIDPWMARETGALIDVARPVSDAAVARWLRFVELDHYDNAKHAAELLDELQGNTISFRDRAVIADLDLG